MFYNVILVLVRIAFLFVFRFKFINRDNIPADGGVILAGNHRSNLDVIAIGLASKRQLNFMAKKSLFKNKAFGWLISHLGAFPVDRSRGDTGAIKMALSRLKDQKVLLIFPEGTRVKDNQRVSAKQGAAMLALHAKVPVVPVRTKGDYKFMSKITIEFGEPIYLNEYYDQKLEPDKQQWISEYIMDKIYEL